MMTPTVPTTKDHSTVLVLQDTLEMESLVLVMTAYLICSADNSSFVSNETSS